MDYAWLISTHIQKINFPLYNVLFGYNILTDILESVLFWIKCFKDNASTK